MEFKVRIMAAAISITFLQLSLCGHVTAAASGCEGGQAEGDKWFDGCRWCVCENSVAVCSSSACSELNAQLPPCESVGSSWWDGCYQCTCFTEGIECSADRTCVALIKNQRFQTRMAYALSQGACIKPQDNRCVCGVDGVPSCTADAIDRNALEATTISLLPPPRSPLTSRRRNLRRMRSRQPSSNFRRPPSSSRRSRTSRTSGYRDGRVRPYRRHLGSERRRMRRLRRSVVRSLVLGQALTADRPIRDVQKAIENSRRKRCVDCDDGEEQELKSRETRGAGPLIPSLTDFVKNEKSPSLLVSTDNRCRWGSRWYGGGLRCYCDQTGAITCGDPRFVASRIDGFLMDRTPCYEGQEWEDPDNCRFCECHVSGVALCWRAESCRVPFLIATVKPARYSDDSGDSSADDRGREDGSQRDTAYRSPDLSRVDDDDDDNDYSGNNGGLRRVASRPRPGVFSALLEEDLPGSGDDLNELMFPRDLSNFRRHRPPFRGSSSGNSRASTTVIVRECKPGRKWKDGCLRCMCTRDGKKECIDKFCLKARTPSRPNPSTSSSNPGSVDVVGTSEDDESMLLGRRIQRPPENWSSRRERPLSPIIPKPNNSCGRFKLNEVYHVDECNTCVCLPTGPKCTAISC